MRINPKGIITKNYISEVGPVDGLSLWLPLLDDSLDYVNNVQVNNVGGEKSVKGYTFSQDDYLNTSWGEDIDLAITPISISVWLKPTSNNQIVLSFGEQQTNDRNLYLEVDNGIWIVNIDDFNLINSNTTAIPNQWYHIVLIMDGFQAFFIINGELTATYSYNSYITSGNLGLNNRSESRSALTVYDLRVFSRILSLEESKILYEREYKSSVINHYEGPKGNNLVSWYPLSNDTEDYASSNNGVNNGAIALPRGYEFNGVDSFIELPTSNFAPNKNVFNDISGSAWIYWYGFGSSSVSGVWGMSGVVEEGDGGQVHWELRATGTRLRLRDIQFIADALPEFNKWQHIGFTYCSVNKVTKQYINGKLIGSAFGETDQISTNRMYNNIGDSHGIAQRPFNGIISDFRLYNKTLTDSEIIGLSKITNSFQKTMITTSIKGQINEC